MPLGFIVIGLICIFALFYFKQHKISTCVFCVLLMLSYFIPCLKLKGSEINITFLIALIFEFVYLVIVQKSFKAFFYALMVNFVYLIVIKFNSDFLTTLNPMFITIVATIVALFVSNKTTRAHFFVSTLLLLTICNCFVDQPLEYVVVGDLNLISYFSVSYLVTKVTYFVKSKFKFLQRRKVWKSY